MNKFKIMLTALMLLLILPFAVSAAEGDAEEVEIPSLAQVYREYFRIGNIMSPPQVTSENITTQFLHHYNSVTAENAMKPEAIAPQKDSFSFIVADILVDWALNNDVEVHGHTLIWHQQSPSWMTTGDDGNPLTRAEAKANMQNYITGYAGHFAGRVSSWDVVNEAFTDSVNVGSRWEKSLRTNSPWYLAYANGADEAAGETPEDYIYDAFVFARLAAPDALLFYNDFNDDEPGKRGAIAEMVEELNAKWRTDDRNTDIDRLLIEVIGMQAHYWTDSLSLDNVRDSIERYIATGAKIAVTELDIPIGSYNGFKTATDEEKQKQATLYRGLFEIYMEYSEHVVRVTIWGKADHQSWRKQGSPVLFDGTMTPKPAFWEVVQLVPDNATPFDLPWWATITAIVVIVGCPIVIMVIRKRNNRVVIAAAEPQFPESTGDCGSSPQ